MKREICGKKRYGLRRDQRRRGGNGFKTKLEQDANEIFPMRLWRKEEGKDLPGDPTQRASP